MTERRAAIGSDLSSRAWGAVRRHNKTAACAEMHRLSSYFSLSFRQEMFQAPARLFQVRATERRQDRYQRLSLQVPPLKPEERSSRSLVKAPLQKPGRCSRKQPSSWDQMTPTAWR